jgi:hypothetical protein
MEVMGCVCDFLVFSVTSLYPGVHVSMHVGCVRTRPQNILQALDSAK